MSNSRLEPLHCTRNAFFDVMTTAHNHFFLNRDMEAIRSLSNQVVTDKEMMGIMNPPAFRYLSITYRRVRSRGGTDKTASGRITSYMASSTVVSFNRSV